MSSRIASLSLRSLAIAISLIAVAAPAWSASPAAPALVTQVRIGNHSTFTRVVFEFDAAAGYGIETTTSEAGKPEILVTLQAGSISRSINSLSEMVQQVTVEDGRSEAVVRIRLNQQPSRIKELILADPPRIVFDFLFPESRLAAIRAEAERKAAAKAAATASAPMTQPQPDASAGPTAAENLAATEAAAKAEAEQIAEPEAAEKAAAEADAKANRLAKAEAEKKAAADAKAEAERIAKLEREKQAAAAKADRLAEAEKNADADAKAEAERIAKREREKQAAAAKADRLAKAEAEQKAAADAKAEAERIADLEAGKNKLAAEKQQADSEERAGEREAEQIAQLPVKPGPPDPDAKPPSFEAEPRVDTPKPRAVAKQTTPPSPAPMGRDDGSSDWVTYGSAAAGVTLLLIGVVLLLRRRKLPNDMDVTALAEEEAVGGGDEKSAIPAGGLSMGNGEPSTRKAGDEDRFKVGTSNVSAGPTAVVGSVDLSSAGVSVPDSGPSIVAGPGLIDDEPEKESNNMVDLESGDLPTDRTQSEIPIQASGVDPQASPGGGGGDVARLVQELERRVAQMETRLDESIDARERLERQVAAQSEELRVQRAAIARTQRALRTINRSDDDQATEPALREPSKSAGE